MHVICYFTFTVTYSWQFSCLSDITLILSFEQCWKSLETLRLGTYGNKFIWIIKNITNEREEEWDIMLSILKCLLRGLTLKVHLVLLKRTGDIIWVILDIPSRRLVGPWTISFPLLWFETLVLNCYVHCSWDGLSSTVLLEIRQMVLALDSELPNMSCISPFSLCGYLECFTAVRQSQ